MATEVTRLSIFPIRTIPPPLSLDPWYRPSTAIGLKQLIN